METNYISEENLKYFRLRRRRDKQCFSIINRGQLWYDTLTEVQKEELRAWYKAWLDVTVTFIEPVPPVWLR